jgi:hypothetical protein
MIPDRRFSSRKISDEGVLWSSREYAREGKIETWGHTLASLKVLVKNMASFGIFAILLNNNARATHNLPGIAIPVNFAEACPFTQDLRTKRLNKFDILSLRTGLNKYTEVGMTPVQSLRTLTQAASKTVVFERLLQNLLIVPTKLRNMYWVKVALFTSSASSTDSFPLGASGASATSAASTSTSTLSPASDILIMITGHKNEELIGDCEKRRVRFDCDWELKWLQVVMSSSAFVDMSENLSSRRR